MPSLAWLVTLVIVLVIVGAVLYLVDRLPIDATIKMFIRVITIVVFAVWLLLQLRALV